jgi:hypothetical protein
MKVKKIKTQKTKAGKAKKPSKTKRARKKVRPAELRSAIKRGPEPVIPSSSKPEIETKVTPVPAPPPEFKIPAGYGDNRIVLMTRDPWWVYAYWEIQGPKEEELRNTIRAKGFDNPKSILRIYDVTDIDFNGSNAHGFFDIELRGLANNWYISVGKPNRSWVADIGLLTPSRDFFLLARSNCVRTPRFGMSEVTDEEWFSPAEDYWKMFGVAGGGKLGQSSIELKEIVEKKIKEQISSGAVSSLFSPMGGEKRGFWLVVATDLIVYGATEKDASVTVQGKPITLREDGTFSLRFSLPDGEQVIPVKAVSSDKKEEKTITPIVTKKTA